jgi:hypothetical protein
MGHHLAPGVVDRLVELTTEHARLSPVPTGAPR